MVFNFDYTASVINTFYDNVIFYIADDNIGFGNFNPGWVNRYHMRTEKKVSATSRMCIVTSDYMFRKISAYQPRTYNIPLGAPEIKLKEIIIREKKDPLPILGLVGYLDSNLDELLLDTLLKKFKIHFIGPASKETINKMEQYENALMLGPKTGEDLYQALQHVDVCIAPYDLKKINKGATPNKLWLYLAMGRPSVITKIPNIESWKFEEDLVYICENKDFEINCIEAYLRDNATLYQKRIVAASNSSWNKRIEQIKVLFYNSLSSN